MTVSSLIAAGGQAALQAEGSSYKLDDIRAFKGWKAVKLIDPATGTAVPLVWSDTDDVAGTLNDRMRLVAALIRNGIDALTELIKKKSE